MLSGIFTHLNLCLANAIKLFRFVDAIHNFKWLKIS